MVVQWRYVSNERNCSSFHHLNILQARAMAPWLLTVCLQGRKQTCINQRVRYDQFWRQDKSFVLETCFNLNNVLCCPATTSYMRGARTTSCTPSAWRENWSPPRPDPVSGQLCVRGNHRTPMSITTSAHSPAGSTSLKVTLDLKIVFSGSFCS